MIQKLLLLSLSVILVACNTDQSFEGIEVKEYKETHRYLENEGQVDFLMNSLGSLSLTSLFAVNILPIKIYGTALLMMEPGLKTLNGNDLPRVMQKFGFIHPDSIRNWNRELSPEPKIKGSVGFIHTQIRKNILGRNLSIEVANITCAACHSSVVYDEQGLPTKSVWLGGGNSSLNLDGFLNQIYFGLKKGMENPENFIAKMKEAYPEMEALEEKTIRKYIMPEISKALVKYKDMGRVLPFPNGGPGHTNGIGAFKRDAKILSNPFQFHAEEAGMVSIPNIINKGFRSSFTIDGAYGVIGQPRFEPISRDRAESDQHLEAMANLAAFFTYSAMGNSINNIEPNIPRVQGIFTAFIKHLKSPKFPGKIDREKAQRGERHFRQSCTSCHGVYSEGIDNIELLSFPNKLIPQNIIGSDPYRWRSIDQKIIDFSKSNVIAKYVNPGMNLQGYVAPILSGLWFKAPYLHNGSVPTLWHLMNPSERPVRFQLGGHALDYTTVGIKGKLNEKGDYVYPENYRPWAGSVLFDTRENGKSHAGHERFFSGLSASDKWDLIEYLKLL